MQKFAFHSLCFIDNLAEAKRDAPAKRSGRFLYIFSRGKLTPAYIIFFTRYGWGWDNYKKEVNTGEGLKIQDWMRGYLTYGLPVIVLFIFAFGIYDKFFA